LTDKEISPFEPPQAASVTVDGHNGYSLRHSGVVFADNSGKTYMLLVSDNDNSYRIIKTNGAITSVNRSNDQVGAQSNGPIEHSIYGRYIDGKMMTVVLISDYNSNKYKLDIYSNIAVNGNPTQVIDWKNFKSSTTEEPYHVSISPKGDVVVSGWNAYDVFLRNDNGVLEFSDLLSGSVNLAHANDLASPALSADRLHLYYADGKDGQNDSYIKRLSRPDLIAGWNNNSESVGANRYIEKVFDIYIHDDDRRLLCAGRKYNDPNDTHNAAIGVWTYNPANNDKGYAEGWSGTDIITNAQDTETFDVMSVQPNLNVRMINVDGQKHYIEYKVEKDQD